MLAEAIAKITDMARDAQRVQVLRPEGERPEWYYLVHLDGRVETHRAFPPPRNHQALHVETVIDFARNLCAAEQAEDTPVALWYSRAGVTLLCDDEDRRDRVVFKLDLSPQLLTLIELEKTRKALTQRDTVFLLRTTFADCMALEGNLLEILRGVRFRTAGDSASSLQHGKRSIGKSLEQEVTGTGSIPEYVRLDVPVFANMPVFSAPVRCALEPDPASETFQLLPLPGQIELAIQAAEQHLGRVIIDGLAQTEVEVYLGQP